MCSNAVMRADAARTKLRHSIRSIATTMELEVGNFDRKISLEMSGSFADVVYWEKQGANRMCALHCVNSLVQAPAFSEFEFNKFSKELDAAERMLWKTAAESENADTTGYYSIGVIEKALQRVGNFQVVNVTRPDVWAAVLREIAKEQGFVFNLRDHWLCVRRINGRWWNLDSLKKNPEPLSEIETKNFLLSAVQAGYSVFAIRGDRTLPLPVVRKEKLNLDQQLFTIDQIAKITGRPIPAAQPYTPVASPLATQAQLAKVGNFSQQAELVPEPSADTPDADIATLAVRTKTGKRESRKFLLRVNSVRQVFQWVQTLEPEAKSLWRVGPPRSAVELNEKTLEQAGFSAGQEMLLIQ